MSLAIERFSVTTETDRKLNISVIFTSVESTLAALKGSWKTGERSSRENQAGCASDRAVPARARDSAGPVGDSTRIGFGGDGKRKPGGDERADLFVPRSLRNADQGFDTRLHRGSGRAQEMVADKGKISGSPPPARRLRGALQRDEVNWRRSVSWSGRPDGCPENRGRSSCAPRSPRRYRASTRCRIRPSSSTGRLPCPGIMSGNRSVRYRDP